MFSIDIPIYEIAEAAELTVFITIRKYAP